MRATRLSQPLFLIIICLSIFISTTVIANTYKLPANADTVIGALETIQSEFKDTLLDIARANGLGYHEVKLVNPDLDTWLPGEGADILLPSQFVLPQAPHNGIILNIPEMRLYYFPDKKKNADSEVITYPLGVGREGWFTPYIDTKIIEKKQNPYWHPPKSIRKEHEEMGDPLPRSVAPGPNNPLGDYALRLGLPQYLIHGTNKPFGIGMRVSHGCIRLYPEDIKKLYQEIKLGTPVHIINQPYKVGQRDGEIYLEAHPYLQEDEALFKENLTSVVRLLLGITDEHGYEIDWNLAKTVVHELKGIPIKIGKFINTAMISGDTENNFSINIKPPGLELRLATELPIPVQ